ncbi:MFS transporter [Noviherbaspirillum sp. Root189]|uniref:MFS transporter n=1 Tax=Noviherbaspirillum sp. Root189 TaxID=1736487 RepID=UPI000AFC65B7|nr:MFS transporter [Noviherbaspirillum sp. Root189]
MLLGVTYATWASRIPAVRDSLQLNPAELGIVLLGAGIGAVMSFPVAAWLIRHRGGRHAAMITGIALLLGLPLLAKAPDFSLLVAAALLYGGASSSFDVAINAIGAEAEKRADRSIMSALHAWFCVGTVSGALAGSALAAAGVSVSAHFVGVALVLSMILWASYTSLPHDRPDPQANGKSFAIPHGPAVMLGVICFCGAVAEGSVADWSGVFMKDKLGVGDGVAPLGFAAFSAMMLAARLGADRLKDRFGARRVVATGTLIAAVGIFLAVPAVNTVTTILGFALAGAGLASLFPFVYSAAGRHGSTALAAVATFGYSGNLIGPPIIGFVANGWGLQAAIGVLGVACVFIAAAAYVARTLD